MTNANDIEIQGTLFAFVGVENQLVKLSEGFMSQLGLNDIGCRLMRVTVTKGRVLDLYSVNDYGTDRPLNSGIVISKSEFKSMIADSIQLEGVSCSIRGAK